MPLSFSDAEVPKYAHAKEGDRHQRYNAKRPRRGRKIKCDPRDRPMIAWDGEGMKLSGENKPQHYVLYGCSAEPDTPLKISDPDGKLTFPELAHYMCNVADRYPTAFHVGYFFSYDHNMIIQSLTPGQKLRLYETNKVTVKTSPTCKFRIQWVPSKRIRITRIMGEKKSSLTIDDIAPFFQTAFVKAYSGMFPDKVDTDSFRKIVAGKNDRSVMFYEHMDRVQEYWTAEIAAVQELAERFREIMYDAGFELTEWYGPGALANLLRRTRGLVTHEWGGKESNMPPQVHDASKRAYFGGHVEQYQAGRIDGPIYVYDVNSAYPAAFAEAPSLAEGGIWQHVLTPNKNVRIGVYRMRHQGETLLAWEPQPLPHRDQRGNTSYPPMVEGWYWAPEAAYAHKYYGADVLEGWEWWPADPSVHPWGFFRDMYEQRRALKRMKSPMERAFKLSLNSMYGKMAQRAGWDEENGLPPRAHTLPLAGFVTSYCRAMILEMLAKMDPAKVIAVETDGVFSTQSPEELGVPISEELGEWSVKVWDEIIYVQNGLYLYRTGDEWHNKTRGMDARSITFEFVRGYLQSLKAGEAWEPAEVPQGERFIGLGAAIARSRNLDGKLNPFKMGALHCRWFTNPRNMAPGLKGKRIHISHLCPACLEGHNAFTKPHRLIVRSLAIQHPMSHPYRLPWERNYEKAEWQEYADAHPVELRKDQT